MTTPAERLIRRTVAKALNDPAFVFQVSAAAAIALKHEQAGRIVIRLDLKSVTELMRDYVILEAARHNPASARERVALDHAEQL